MTAQPAATPVLLELTRGGLVESVHRGSLVLLDARGAIDVAIGDVTSPVYARSALKPLQTVAMLASGFTGPSEFVALASASHNGEDLHLAGARAILAAAGLDESALQCPPALPREQDVMLAYLAGGGRPAPICYNCSGKHSAMLATCVAAGWDIGTYLEPDHPLQRAIVEVIERLCAMSIGATSVDGCGAPAHAVPLVGLARSFAAVASAQQFGAAQSNTAAVAAQSDAAAVAAQSDAAAVAAQSDAAAVAAQSNAAAVAAAMRAHPLLVGGTGREVTELMAEVDGLICKDGAEAVWAAALPDGRAFATKIADGSSRTLGPVLAAALRYWGHDGPAVRRWSSVAVLGGGQPVGELSWSTELRERLAL